MPQKPTPDEMTAMMTAHAEAALRDAEEHRNDPLPVDPTCLSYWFPKIHAAGLPVPRTKIVTMDVGDTRRDMFEVFDGKPMGPAAVKWMAEFKATAE